MTTREKLGADRTPPSRSKSIVRLERPVEELPGILRWVRGHAMAVRLAAGHQDSRIDRPAAEAHPAWLRRLCDLFEQLNAIGRVDGRELANSLSADVAVVVTQEPSELRGDRAIWTDGLKPCGSDRSEDRFLVLNPARWLGTVNQRTQCQRTDALVLGAGPEVREQFAERRYGEICHRSAPQRRRGEPSRALTPGQHVDTERYGTLRVLYGGGTCRGR